MAEAPTSARTRFSRDTGDPHKMRQSLTMITKDAGKITNEDTPLLESVRSTLSEAYSLDCPCTFEDGVVADYEPYKFATLRVFCAWKGTVLEDFVLFTELAFLTLVFAAVAIPVYIMQSKTIGSADKEERRELLAKLVAQEDNMRKFSLIMTMLAAFLLSLYTSIMLGRWWTMRTCGIGKMKAASSELVLYISQFVTTDKQVLSAVRRYSRASLRLLFLWRQGMIHDKDAVQKGLIDSGILTKEEFANLCGPKGVRPCLCEGIWTWQVNIVQALHKEGLIKSQHLLVFLLKRCQEGRSGVQCLTTHLGTKLPMQYVHLLGLIVKVHNLILAVIMGVLFSTALKRRNLIICLQLYGRTMLMPFLLNAILLINAALADPFDGGSAGFQYAKYDKDFEADGESFESAGGLLPPWVDERQGETDEETGLRA